MSAHSLIDQDDKSTPLSSVLFLRSQYCGPLLYNMADDGKGDDGKGDDGKGDDGKGGKGDDGKGGKGDDGKGDDKPKPGTAEYRVMKALEKADAAEARAAAAEKKAADAEVAEKARNDKELQEKGEFKTLAEQKGKEALEHKTARETAEKELTEARKEAEDEIAKVIEGIKDEEKKKTLEDVLTGKSAFEKRRLLPGLMKSMGIGTGAGSFGLGTQGAGAEGTTKLEDKEKEYSELLQKVRDKKASPSEKGKLHTLGMELQKMREADASTKKKARGDEEVVMH